MWVPDWDKDKCHDIWDVESYGNGLVLDVVNNFPLPIEQRRTMIDLGSNVGYTAIGFSKFFEHVYAFEPIKEVYDCLVKNTEKYKNITAFNKAVSNFKGKATFRKGVVSGHSHLRSVDDAQPYGAVRGKDILVEVVKLPDNFENVDLIKMDVQGAEPLILQSHAEFLKNHKPMLVLEHMRGINYHEILDDYGYLVVYKRRNDWIFIHRRKLKQTYHLLPLKWRNQLV